MYNLKRKAISSVMWLALLRYSTRVIDLFKYFLITRILAPTDIGNFVLATTIVITFDALSDTGLHFAFIQKQTNISLYAKTLWVISIIRGFLIGGVVLLTATLFSSFFESPSLLQLLLVIAVVPIIKGFQSPYVITFQKNLEFRKEFLFRFVPVVVASLVSIILAVLTKDALGLVIAIIVGSIIEVISSFIVTKTSFPHPFSLQRAKTLFRYGKHLTIGSIFTLLMTQADSLFVGRFFGPASLASYELAFKLANVAFTEVTDVVSRVSFPLFSKLQKDRKRLTKSFQINLLLVSIPAILACVLFLIFPSFILSTAFGNSYKGASVLLQILSVYGLLRAMVGPTGPFLLAIGKPQATTVMNFLNFLFLIILLYPLSQQFGLNGVALSMTVAYILVQPYLFYQIFLFFRSQK